MGKALILIVTASLIGAGLTLFTGVQQTTFKAEQELGEHEVRVLARQIALSAVSEARANVLSKPALVESAVQYTGSAMGGTYKTTITPSGEGESLRFAIHVESRMPRGSGESAATHTIALTYAPAPDSGINLDGDGVPEFFNYALLMDGPLRVSGNMDVRGGPSLNADVHTNQDIFLEGGNFVGGFGTYVTTAASNPPRRLHTTFSPSVNPDNLPTVQQTQPVNVLKFNASEYSDLATRTFEGDLNVSGDYTFGPRERPEIWYVMGDLTVSSGARLDGYVIFLVQGDIKLTGSFLTTGAVGNESTVGFYTSGSVTMSGTVEVSGQFLARHDLTFSGTSVLHGNVTVGGTVVWGGTPTVYYREASPALTTPLWPEDAPGFADWRPIDYREWAGRSNGSANSASAE